MICSTPTLGSVRVTHPHAAAAARAPKSISAISPQALLLLQSQSRAAVSNRSRAAQARRLTSLVEQQSSAPLSDEAPREEKAAPEPFDWNKWWYAAVLLEDLEPKKPTPVKVLGKDLVLWRDVNQEWRCFADICPHRLAPLSEGRIEPSDGSLMCSYHGWRFQSDGQCTKIPQAKDGGKSTGCKNPRSKAQAYPVMIHRGIVWVWPDESATAFIDSSMAKPNEPEIGGHQGGVYMRDLPYPIDGLIENVIDAAHPPFSHHGIQGDRETAPPLSAKALDGDSPMSLEYKMAIGDTSSSFIDRRIKFNGPDHIAHSFVPLGGNSNGMFLNIHGTPTSSTTCRVFTYTTWTNKPGFMQSLKLKMSTMTSHRHLFGHRLFDGDTVFINGQSRRLRAAEEAGKSWNSEYYMPTTADLPIAGFRKWLHGPIGGAGPKLPNGDSLLSNSFQDISKEDLLDRFYSHTENCRICQRALVVVRVLKTTATLLACASTGLALFMGRMAWTGVESNKKVLFGLLIGGLVLGFARQKLAYLESLYYHRDYAHWKI